MIGRFHKASGPVRHCPVGRRQGQNGIPHWWLRCPSCQHLTLAHERQVTGQVPIRCDSCGYQATEEVLPPARAKAETDTLFRVFCHHQGRKAG